MNSSELVYDAVYLNPLTNLNQCYTTNEIKSKGKKFRLNTVIFTKVKVK